MRVAGRARASNSRRRCHEHANVEAIATAEATQDRPPDHETQLILDEEIGRLPEKQQAAVVLCLVQGKTHESAAAELGCPLGTIKTRIAAGRATLARKLARRGLAPSIALGAASISENLMARSVPQELARDTLEAATRFAVSRSINGAAIAVSVGNLMEGVLSTMRLARMKSIPLSFLVAVVLAGVSAALVVVQTGRARDKDHVEPVPRVTPSAFPARLDVHGDPLPANATLRFGTIRHRQGSPIHRISYSADGKFVVTDGDDRRMRLWDPQDGRLIRELDVRLDLVRDSVLSADGAVLAAVGVELDRRQGTEKHKVTYTQLAPGKRAATEDWELPTDVTAAAFSPDGHALAIGNGGGTVRVLDAQERAGSFDFEVGKRQVIQIAFAFAGKRIAALSCDPGDRPDRHHVNVLDLDRRKELRAFPKLPIMEHGTVRLWDATSGKQRTVLNHAGKPQAIALSKDNRFLLSGTREWSRVFRKVYDDEGRKAISRVASGTIVLVAADSGKPTLQIEVPNSEVWSVAFSPDGKTLAATTGWETGQIHLYEVATGKEFRTIETPAIRTPALTFTPDGSNLVCGMADTSILMWDLKAMP